MQFVGFVSKAVAGTAAAVVICVGGLTYYAFSRPFASVDVPIRLPGVTVRFEVWSDFGGERYWLVTSTPSGSAKRKLWSNWGPASRANFYWTSDDWLVVLGGGGDAEMVDLKNASAPHERRRSPGTQTDSGTWIYLGAVDFLSNGAASGYRFFTPSQRRECFAMLGAGFSPYRHQHQAQGPCP